MATAPIRFNVVASWITANGKRRSDIYLVDKTNEVAAVQETRELLLLDQGAVRDATFRTIRAC
ncbi:hypothetical protein [Bradyrhizobium sp. SZCCHNR2012]|uniref:hypothetical protein n=1 Tax=Bradyrhizobium sp. SZCCHNR2012 TaxID=3057377 RepID=UPI0028F010D3|nr:hypothetical protein [Bradyrhizobium sp. SZCCHNR2012]